MFEILPRFEILRLSGVPYDKIYFHRPELPFQKETFAMMGLQVEQMIWAAPDMHVRAKQVIIPSIPSLHANPSSWVCQFLRDQFLSPLSMPRNKRIFVSRKQAVYRHLVNESELMEILSQYGFEEVVLEGMTVSEQIRLFQASEIVVAPHGAGLSHLVFCDPGTKMVEIFNPNWLCDCYWKLSQHVGLKHFCLLGTPVEAPRTPEEKYDYHYDCSGFERFLCEEVLERQHAESLPL
jgi:capsular polysaccharide biosynthesis protein